MTNENEHPAIYLQYAPGFETRNTNENREAIKKALDDVGFFMNELGNGVVSITLLEEQYSRMKNRGAGRRQKIAHAPSDIPEDFRDKYGMCRFSDIVWMSQTMTDKQISDKVGMKIATYYRHKKKLKESEYYSRLDKNRLQDLDYLKSVKGDMFF